MATSLQPILIATRGSALALAQAHTVFALCRQTFPQLRFEIKILKTTGDKLQSASLARPDASLPKGLFTKELETALLEGRADLAVHSLKDLPTDLPAGLVLGAVTARADVRDVLITRDTGVRAASAPGDRAGERSPRTPLAHLPAGATVATSSTRRRAQLLAARPDLSVVEIRGNVVTRLQKLANQAGLDATVLAAAGLARLNFTITTEGRLIGDAVPEGLVATVLDPEVMLPCVGQAAIGLEIREHDERLAGLCRRLNHHHTFQCITAERAFLHAMGGGCQSPVAGYAEVVGDLLRLRARSFRDGPRRDAESRRDLREPVALGEAVALQLT